VKDLDQTYIHESLTLIMWMNLFFMIQCKQRIP